MGAITTPAQQSSTAAAARRVGGYAELVRLAKEQSAAGGHGRLVQDTSGRWSFRPEPPRRGT